MKTYNRRDFLVLSTSAVAGFAAIAAAGPGPNETSAADFVATGFYGEVPRLSRRFGLTTQTIVAAAGVTNSDPSLLRNGARVAIRGFFPTAERREPRSIFVAVAYPTLDASASPQYLAFSASANTKQGRTSSPVAFTVGVTPDRGFDIVIDRTAGGRTERAVVTLAVNPKAGELPLNRGVYILALMPNAGDPSPSWSALKLRSEVTAATVDPRGDGLLLSTSFGKEVAVPFDYIVVSVADATATPNWRAGAAEEEQKQ